jgi:hypothetical protein
MALELLIAFSMVVFTKAVHGLGLTGLLGLVTEHGRWPSSRRAFLVGAAMTLMVVNGVFFLHMFEILAYAVLYRGLGAIRNFHDAFVFSAGAYSTVGSEVQSRGWRLLAKIEAINGMLLIGWSTAFFVSVIANLRALLEHRTRRQ